MNNQIRVPEIRCIDENGEQMGIIPTRQALVRAHEAGLDLVEISATCKPPVCRIMDHGKFKFETEKKKKEQKKKQNIVKLKEVKFHVNVSMGFSDVPTIIHHRDKGFIVDSVENLVIKSNRRARQSPSTDGGQNKSPRQVQIK